MKLVGYCRVSTDDKGQNPQRQRDVQEATAKRDGHEMVAWFMDEGTSGGISPLVLVAGCLAATVFLTIDSGVKPAYSGPEGVGDFERFGQVVCRDQEGTEVCRYNYGSGPGYWCGEHGQGGS